MGNGALSRAVTTECALFLCELPTMVAGRPSRVPPTDTRSCLTDVGRLQDNSYTLPPAWKPNNPSGTLKTTVNEILQGLVTRTPLHQLVRIAFAWRSPVDAPRDTQFVGLLLPSELFDADRTPGDDAGAPSAVTESRGVSGPPPSRELRGPRL